MGKSTSDWAQTCVTDFLLSPFLLTCLVCTTLSINLHSPHTQRDRDSYSFHLRLADSCNMLVTAEPATITLHTVPPSKHQWPLDSNTYTHDRYIKMKKTKDLDQYRLLMWLNLCEIRGQSVVFTSLSPFLLSCVASATNSIPYNSLKTITGLIALAQCVHDYYALD